MTYIEFFDKTAAENISACLSCPPKRVIYIGDNSKLMKKHIANYEQVFSARGQKIEFLFKTVSNSNLDNAVALLTEIVETYRDCVFDITGGDEMLILALGIVYAKNPDKNMQIHKFNLRSNAVYDCDKDGKTIYKDAPALSVDENIRIYGGKVAYGTVDESKTYQWDLTPDFLRDVALIWSVCRSVCRVSVRRWNWQICIFEAAEIVGAHGEDPLTTVASLSAMEQYLQQHKMNYRFFYAIISRLLKYGLLTYYEDTETTVTIAYKNEQVKKCLTKAGQALEMKVYITAKGILDKNGSPVYSDALQGVVIDWDGEFHDESTENDYNTENEIDILLMHGVVPVFISCKNGTVTSNELYKLNTVAERFGDRYAKKILVTTSISDFGDQGMYLRQRAKDMNIKIIEGVQNMEDAALGKELGGIWNG